MNEWISEHENQIAYYSDHCPVFCLPLSQHHLQNFAPSVGFIQSSTPLLLMMSARRAQ